MARMTTDRTQDLRILDGRFRIEHDTDDTAPLPAGDRLALVHGPDGRTVIRRDDDAADGGWVALWSGDQPHDPQATGMLSAIVGPLGDAAVPVMAASTFHADLVLVPSNRLDDAVAALRGAGHRVG
jgi:hypothetical protein